MIFPCKHLPDGGTRLLATIILIAAVLLWSVPGASQSEPGSNRSGQPAQTIITSDRLVTDNRAKLAEFTGNVKVNRAGSVITADRLEVYYADSDGNNTGGVAAGGAVVEKIVAEGNVHIQSADLVAAAQKGVFIRKTQKITLSGDNTTATSGGHSITGSEIVLLLDKDRIRVTGGPQDRVKVIFDPAAPKK